MKHIAKKFLHQVEITDNIRKVIEIKGEQVKRGETGLQKRSKSKDIYLESESNHLIKSLLLKKNGKEFIIPIPDLSLVYFDSAYNLNVLRKDQELKLYEKLMITPNSLGEDATNEVYRYYGYASSFIISLFTSIESFINHIIPDEGIYIREIPKRRTEHYNKEQIQRELPFNEKTRKVLPFFFDKKNFFLKSTLANEKLNKLKELRDDIVHTKSDSSFKSQEELIKKLLNFPFEETLESVAKFMNFYKPNFITECQCGLNF